MLKKYAMLCQVMFVLRNGQKEQWMALDSVFSVSALAVFSASGCGGMGLWIMALNVAVFCVTYLQAQLKSPLIILSYKMEARET